MPASRLGHYRRSCDRCHGQKLRCRRDDGSHVCQRCQRAKAKCVFSAPARPRWPAPFVPSGPAAGLLPSADAADAHDAGAPPPDPDQPSTPSLAETPGIPWDTGPIMLPLDLTADAAYGQAGAAWGAVAAGGLPRASAGPERAWLQPGSTSPASAVSGIPASSGDYASPANALLPQERAAATPPDPRQTTLHGGRPASLAAEGARATAGRAVRRLSNLNLELYELALGMPSVGDCWDPDGVGPMAGKEFALDRVLGLSQSFIEALDQLSLCSPPPPSAAATPESSGPARTRRTPSSSSSSSSSSPSSPPPVLDQPCELLVVSSYARIVETYHTILEHVAACVRRHRDAAGAKLPASLADGFPRLPSLAVGSFTMEASNATQVLVLVHMMEAMMARSRRLVQRIMTRPAPPSPEPLSPDPADGPAGAQPPTAGQAALWALSPRQDATLRLLATVRRALLDLGHA